MVEIYDPTGKQINVHNMNQKNYELMVNLSGYSNGVYQLIVRYENGYVWNSKLVKQ